MGPVQHRLRLWCHGGFFEDATQWPSRTEPHGPWSLAAKNGGWRNTSPLKMITFQGRTVKLPVVSFNMMRRKRRKRFIWVILAWGCWGVIWSPNVKICLSFREWLNVFGLTWINFLQRKQPSSASAWNTTQASVYGTPTKSYEHHGISIATPLKVESMFSTGLLQVELDGRRVIAVPVDTWQGDFRLTALK